MVHYTTPIISGLDAVASLGDGYSVNVKWFQAYPDIFTNKIAYHIYFSTDPDAVFEEGVKYVIIDGSLNANVIDLTPGQMYWFSVRPVEYDPVVVNFLSNLPISHDNVRFYPSSMLRQNMDATQLFVPLVDVESFPSTGFVKVGAELIQYLAVDSVNDNLIVPAPGGAISAYFIVQSNGKIYLPSASNVGQGSLTSMSIVGNKVNNETWNVRCVAVQRDSFGNPIPSTALFEAVGSISGNVRDGYGNVILWRANGPIVSNGIVSFAVVETAPSFQPNDSFIFQIAGATPGSTGGRGYGGTQARPHTVAGFDGYYNQNPIVSMIAFAEDTNYDNIYACKSRFEYPHFPFTVMDGYSQVTQDYLSTDLSAADAANVGFPTYDYAGWHRTDPVLLLNGTCVGSYIGGQMGCIDKYGNYNVVRGMSLQESERTEART